MSQDHLNRSRVQGKWLMEKWYDGNHPPAEFSPYQCISDEILPDVAKEQDRLEYPYLPWEQVGRGAPPLIDAYGMPVYSPPPVVFTNFNISDHALDYSAPSFSGNQASTQFCCSCKGNNNNEGQCFRVSIHQFMF